MTVMRICAPFGGWGIGAILLLVLAGCGGRGDSPVSPVSGKVSFRGQPLTQGTIVFTPDSARGTNGAPVWADLSGDGGYQLKTGNIEGIASGWYRITVAAVEPPAMASGQSFTVPRSLLPDKYRDPELSGLKCEIKPGRANTVNFNLD
jgi:hypothetical protein